MSEPAPARLGEPPATSKATRALAELYTRHWGELVAYIRRTCGAGPPEPEDAVQAPFAQFAALKSPEAVENPRAFLFRTARNFVVDHRRKDAG